MTNIILSFIGEYKDGQADGQASGFRSMLMDTMRVSIQTAITPTRSEIRTRALVKTGISARAASGDAASWSAK
jgi:hypothetical protein